MPWIFFNATICGVKRCSASDVSTRRASRSDQHSPKLPGYRRIFERGSILVLLALASGQDKISQHWKLLDASNQELHP